MQMHVLVCVDVIKGETGPPERRELGTDLLLQLPARGGVEEKTATRRGEIGRKRPVRLHERGDVPWRQHRCAANEDHVQPDPQPRISPRAGYRIVGRRRSDHQARGGQHALVVRPFDCLVDRRREAEVVGGDNQRPQALFSRSARKRKNSTPSRSRRFIISLLFSIS